MAANTASRLLFSIAPLALAGLVSQLPQTLDATGSGHVFNVDLELVLAVDASGSMSGRELVAQREGYVAAFRHPEVIRAVGSGSLGQVAVAYIEWGGAFDQTVIVPWMVIAGERDAERFAKALEAAPLRPQFVSPPWLTGTSISAALLFSAALIAENDLSGMHAVIDISGNGANNTGAPVEEARDAIVAKGITINGLPLALRADERPIEAYYENCVIGGPGSFTLTVSDASMFEVAIQRKLVLEIAGVPVRYIHATHDRPRRARLGCSATEAIRE